MRLRRNADNPPTHGRPRSVEVSPMQPLRREAMGLADRGKPSYNRHCHRAGPTGDNTRALSSVFRARTPGNSGSSTGNAEPRAFCVLTSGREVTQLTGQCRGRTHVPMALCQTRRPWPCCRDHNEQANRPMLPVWPCGSKGAWKCECSRYACGSPSSTAKDGRRATHRGLGSELWRNEK